ncbi:MAG TPA: 4-alpha-glucanotransferase [Gemmataceae bacterium]|nr:4-alpha-glucanotransferase [Gemmataceae bacterium]
MSDPSPAKSRSAGLLLHPTSLPGPFGVGDLGPAAFAWIDLLAAAKQSWWQILPLGMTSYGDSPYQCYSAFAGNTLLVSPQVLREQGLIDENDWSGLHFPSDHVDYADVFPFKKHLLQRAWRNFQAGRGAGLKEVFDAFRHESRSWLEDVVLFLAIKDENGGKGWLEWPLEIRRREPAAMESARKRLAGATGQHAFAQFLFFAQWRRLREYAHERGIKIIGDIPIFVSGDSADVWANPEFFQLDAERKPRAVAGVPPDYFNADGQLWGNPLYDWTALEKTGFAWWKSRVRGMLGQVDLIRLDHFRGFESYWEVPSGSPTARNGKWVPAPGDALLSSLKAEFGALPFIAEDLGLITPQVEHLRDRHDLPGMKVLQFAFGDDFRNPYLPHNHKQSSVVYTGTHDNDTTRGWYRGAQEKEKDHVRRYLARDGSDVSWDMIRVAWMSVADLAIAPLQDVLDLGSEARMNFPGRASGNWTWRYEHHQINTWTFDRLAELTWLYGRARR